MEVNAIGPLLLENSHSLCAIYFFFSSSLNTTQNRIPSKAKLQCQLRRDQQPLENHYPGCHLETPPGSTGTSQLSGVFSASLEWIMYMKVCSMVKSGGRLPLCTPTCLLMRLRVEL